MEEALIASAAGKLLGNINYKKIQKTNRVFVDVIKIKFMNMSFGFEPPQVNK